MKKVLAFFAPVLLLAPGFPGRVTPAFGQTRGRIGLLRRGFVGGI
jgi:hypothetical protein